MNYKISRKNFLRLGAVSAVSTTLGPYLVSCGGGGGGDANAAAAVDAGSSGSTTEGGATTTFATPASAESQSTLPTAQLLWSSPATWGTAVPKATDAVTIAAGKSILLDTAAVCLSLDIQGTLVADQSVNVSITTGSINVGPAGVLAIGSEATPYTKAALIELNGAEASRAPRTGGGFTNAGLGRSIQVQPGGKLSLIGVAPTVKRTKLNASAAAGAKTFTLADSTGWKAGDEIAFGTTDFFGVSAAEKLVLAGAASGNTVTTAAGLASKRWGVLQYVTDSGISLTRGTFTNAPSGAATVIDERAFVIHLTRNIVVQGANDAAWASSRFGAHCMFMGLATDVKIDGVQFRRVGQAGALGRYPVHWHMASYEMAGGMNSPSSGKFLGAFATGTRYVKNCAFSESSQRMVTLHGTHGVTVDSNVGFDITGHAIFLEDGSEQNNFISNNVVLKVRAPTAANRLIASDVAGMADSGLPGTNLPQGSAGVWFTNPSNTLVGNWVSDSEGCGIWNSFATQCFGLSVSVAISPNNLPFLKWDSNTAMGCSGVGIMTALPVVDGTTGALDDNFYDGGLLDHPISNAMSFKNSGGGYNNRVNTAKYDGFVLADNAGMDVFGAAQNDLSVALRFLSVAETLNNTNSKYLSSKRAAFATYHELLNFQDTTVVGYKYQLGQQFYKENSPIGGGIFRMQDLYIAPVLSFYANTGLRQVNCEPPFRVLPPNLDGYPLQIPGTTQSRNWTLAAAIRDDNGIFVPKGNYWIYDVPFLTYGATGLTDVAPAKSTANPLGNGKYTPDRYFGVMNFEHTNNTKGQYLCQLPITVTRQDSAGTSVGTWTVGDGTLSPILGNMRHFAAHNGGRFQLQFPGNIASTFVYFDVTGMQNAADIFLLGVEFAGTAATTKVIQRAGGFLNFDGSAPPALYSANDSTARTLTAAGSMAEVSSDTQGTVFWYDTANKMVWFKVKVAGLGANFSYSDAYANAYKAVAVAVVA